MGEAGEPANKRQRLESVVHDPRTAAREAGGQSSASRTQTGGAALVAIRTTPCLTEKQQQPGQRIRQGLRRRPWWRRPRRPKPRAWPRRQPRKVPELM